MQPSPTPHHRKAEISYHSPYIHLGEGRSVDYYYYYFFFFKKKEDFRLTKMLSPSKTGRADV